VVATEAGCSVVDGGSLDRPRGLLIRVGLGGYGDKFDGTCQGKWRFGTQHQCLITGG
jgi:hypothetical protein